MDNTVTLFVISLITGILGYYLRYNLERKEKLINEATNERRKNYQNFINIVIDIFSSTNDSKKRKKQDDEVSRIYEVYKSYILNASPKVLNAFSDYFQFIYKQEGQENLDTKTHVQKLAEIIFYMRKDLGLSNKKLGNKGEKIFRSIFTDYDKIMEDNPNKRMK